MNYKFHFIDFHKNKIEGFDLHIDILISTHRQTNQNTRKIYIYIYNERDTVNFYIDHYPPIQQ